MAPETLNKELQDKEVDIWALGVLLYELFHNKEPYKGSGTQEALKSISTSPLNFGGNVPPEAIDLIKKMLIYSKDKRIKMRDVLNHPFLMKNGQTDAIQSSIFSGKIPQQGIVTKTIQKTVPTKIYTNTVTKLGSFNGQYTVPATQTNISSMKTATVLNNINKKMNIPIEILRTPIQNEPKLVKTVSSNSTISNQKVLHQAYNYGRTSYALKRADTYNFGSSKRDENTIKQPNTIIQTAVTPSNGTVQRTITRSPSSIHLSNKGYTTSTRVVQNISSVAPLLKPDTHQARQQLAADNIRKIVMVKGGVKTTTITPRNNSIKILDEKQDNSIHNTSNKVRSASISRLVKAQSVNLDSKNTIQSISYNVIPSTLNKHHISSVKTNKENNHSFIQPVVHKYQSPSTMNTTTTPYTYQQSHTPSIVSQNFHSKHISITPTIGTYKSPSHISGGGSGNKRKLLRRMNTMNISDVNSQNIYTSSVLNKDYATHTLRYTNQVNKIFTENKPSQLYAPKHIAGNASYVKNRVNNPIVPYYPVKTPTSSTTTGNPMPITTTQSFISPEVKAIINAPHKALYPSYQNTVATHQISGLPSSNSYGSSKRVQEFNRLPPKIESVSTKSILGGTTTTTKNIPF